MSILQHYYTSCQTSEKSGYQVKAKSAGINSETEKTLNTLIGYKIPPECDVTNPELHPIALRYYPIENDAILVSSQSNGQDEFGRPGNYFAHSVIGTLEQLNYFNAPIFCWKSPFWIKRDDSDREELPTLTEFDPEINFDFDEIWQFIEQNNRHEWLYKILCAILDYPVSKRKIVILDEIDNIALWIASITIALLPRYSQSISFATYHHDPYLTPFIITGTTKDSNFRFSNDEYIAYFIVNSLDNRISDAPDSDYARFIIERFNPEQYDAEILDFFNWLERFDSQPKLPEPRLDRLVNFYSATVINSLSPQSEKALVGTKEIVDELSRQSIWNSDDIKDLQNAWKLLGKIIVAAPTPELMEHLISVMQISKRADPNFLQTCSEASDLLVQLTLNKSLPEANQLASELNSLYSEELVIQQFSNPRIIKNIEVGLQQEDIEQIIAFWKTIGKYIQRNDNNKDSIKIIFNKTYAALNNSESIHELKPSQITLSLINNLLTTKEIPPSILLREAANYQRQNQTSPVLQLVYYAVVENLSYKERANKYWKNWQKLSNIIPDFYHYELHRDLIKVNSIDKQINVILQWINFTDRNLHCSIVQEAIKFIWQLPDIDRGQLSNKILSQTEISEKLQSKNRNKLLEKVLSEAKIEKPNTETFKLYQLLLPNIEKLMISKYKIIIQGGMDLYNKEIQENNVSEYYKYFRKLNPEKYKEEANNLVTEFFGSKPDSKVHSKLVRSIYNSNHRKIFWQIYWSSFKNYLLEQQRVNDIVVVLDFWFNSSPHSLEKYFYAVPEFFTELPIVLEDICSNKNYKAISKDFEAKIEQKRWYPIIQKYIKKNKGLIGISSFFAK